MAQGSSGQGGAAQVVAMAMDGAGIGAGVGMGRVGGAADQLLGQIVRLLLQVIELTWLLHDPAQLAASVAVQIKFHFDGRRGSAGGFVRDTGGAAAGVVATSLAKQTFHGEAAAAAGTGRTLRATALLRLHFTHCWRRCCCCCRWCWRWRGFPSLVQTEVERLLCAFLLLLVAADLTVVARQAQAAVQLRIRLGLRIRLHIRIAVAILTSWTRAVRAHVHIHIDTVVLASIRICIRISFGIPLHIPIPIRIQLRVGIRKESLVLGATCEQAEIMQSRLPAEHGVGSSCRRPVAHSGVMWMMRMVWMVGVVRRRWWWQQAGEGSSGGCRSWEHGKLLSCASIVGRYLAANVRRM